MQTAYSDHPPLVCALVYDRLCTFEYGLCVEVFSPERPEISGPLYRFKTVAAEPGPLTAMGGLSVRADEDLSVLNRADLILVPGWRGSGSPPPSGLLDALRRAHANGARIASICSGVFVLAAAGLLNGKKATTHWRYAKELATRYPAIEVLPDILYIEDGTMLTSAGSAAGLDLCLHIVRGDYGPDVANAIARSLVIPAHRDGGQAQFIPTPVAPRQTGNLAPVLDRLRARLDEHWTVASMAGLANMSRRSLLRRFRDACGESPIVWLTRERISKARDLLETTDAGVERVGEAVGFSAPETFRLHFKRHVGTSPGRYRAQFRPAAVARDPAPHSRR